MIPNIDPYTFVNMLGVDYKHSGGRYNICCPFHNDTRPSLVIYPDGEYHCFSCTDLENAHGSWVNLYKTIKNCEWKEAYKALGMDKDNNYERPKRVVHFETIGEPEKAEMFEMAYNRCVNLPDVAKEFLERKKILDVALKLGWRWSEKRKCIVIPYVENGKVVYCRFRDYRKKEDGTMGFTKPMSPAGIPMRPLYLLRNGQDTVYWCEGESDALTVYAQGLSVICSPGGGQSKCINTMALVSEQCGYKKVISCGDNDKKGNSMNELARAAVKGWTSMEIEILPHETFCGMNDLNDVWVAGKLKIGPDPIQKFFPGATELHGWEAIHAVALFSKPEEIRRLVMKEFEDSGLLHDTSLSEEETNFLAYFSTAKDMDRLKSLWMMASPAIQQKYILLKDIMKLALAQKQNVCYTRGINLNERN